MEDEFAKALDALHTSVDSALQSKANAPSVQIDTNPWTKPVEPVVAVVPVTPTVQAVPKKSVIDQFMPILIIGLLGLGSWYVYSYVYKPSLQKEVAQKDTSTEKLQELPNIDLQQLAAIRTQQELSKSVVVPSAPTQIPVVSAPVLNPFQEIKKASPEKSVAKEKGFLIHGEIPWTDSISEEKVVKDTSDKILTQAENDQIAEQKAKRREQQMLEQERLRQEAEAQNLLDKDD